jgi:hypothetical protein
MMAPMPRDDANEPTFVPVMVPAHLVTDVYRFIAQQEAVTPIGESPALDENGAGAAWPPELLAKLSGSQFESMRRLGLVMDALAERPEEWIPTTELIDATGLSRQELQPIWRKLTRHLDKHYSGIGWPVEAQWGPNYNHPTAQTYYMVRSEQAKRWKRVRAQS